MSKKPNWAPDAIATTAGWVNPKTNELLVSVRGLPGALPYIKGRIIHPAATKVQEVVVQAAKDVVDTVVQASEDVQEVVATAVAEVQEAVADVVAPAADAESKPAEKKVFGKKKSKK